MPRDLPRSRNEIDSGRSQRRHVQRLADMANALRSPAVLVDKSASTREV
jgi:hypothetical protein